MPQLGTLRKHSQLLCCRFWRTTQDAKGFCLHLERAIFTPRNVSRRAAMFADLCCPEGSCIRSKSRKPAIYTTDNPEMSQLGDLSALRTFWRLGDKVVPSVQVVELHCSLAN
jgi:hypothetical protein